MPTSLSHFSFGVRKLDFKVEIEGRDQLRHLQPAQICTTVSQYCLQRLLPTTRNFEDTEKVWMSGKLQEPDNAGRQGFQEGTKKSRCIYSDQDRRVPLDQMRRRICLNIIVSQNRKYEAENAVPISALSPVLNDRPGRIDSTSSPKTSMFY